MLNSPEQFILVFRGHHLKNLYNLRSDSNRQEQLRFIERTYGARHRFMLEETFDRLNEDGALVRIVAGLDLFCLQCPKYQERKCLSGEILTDDYFEARRHHSQIGEICTGKLLTERLAKEPEPVPLNVLEDKVLFNLWLERRHIPYYP